MVSWDTLEQDALTQTDRNISWTGKCKFAKFLDSLEPDARRHVDSAMSNNKITGKSLYRALKVRGMDCCHTVFHEHRKSTCACFVKREF